MTSLFLLWLLVVLGQNPGAESPRLMVPDDLDVLAKAPAGDKHAYGQDPLQFGELTLPKGAGPHPVVIFIHGGCWLAAYDLAHSRSLAQSLVADGIAVWNLEYRRVGDTGGGWPGTFLDIANGADHLRKLAEQHSLDLDRTVAMGHSAGGHLALWLAARRKISTGSDVHTGQPLELAGVVALAPASELPELHQRKVCGHVIDKLMGGSPTQHPQRYRDATPTHMVPLGVPQKIIVGAHDSAWRWGGEAYVEAAKKAGERSVDILVAPEAGHFEIIAPQSTSWPLVRDAVRALLKQ